MCIYIDVPTNSMQPLNPDPESSWNRFFVDNQVLIQIDHDTRYIHISTGCGKIFFICCCFLFVVFVCCCCVGDCIPTSAFFNSPHLIPELPTVQVHTYHVYSHISYYIYSNVQCYNGCMIF